MHVPAPKFMEEAGLLQFQGLIKKHSPQPPQVTIDPKKDIAALPYTGGTTGLPKAAILTHYNMVALQAQTASFWPIFEEGREVVIAFLPFFHIYGQVVVMLNGLVQGSTLVLFTTPDMDDILDTDRDAMKRFDLMSLLHLPVKFFGLFEGRVRVNRNPCMHRFLPLPDTFKA